MSSAPKLSRRRFLKILAAGGSVAFAATLPILPEVAAQIDLPAPIQDLIAHADFIARSFAAEDVLVTSQQVMPVAYDVVLTATERIDAAGWLADYVLTVNLANTNITPDLLFSGAVAQTAFVTTMAHRAGAVAASNADFFDDTNTGSAIGAAISSGSLLKSALAASDWKALAIGADRIGRLVQFSFDGTFSSPLGTLALAGLNVSQIPNGTFVAYTPRWSTTTESISTSSASALTLATVQSGMVTAVEAPAIENNRTVLPIPPSDGILLLGSGSAAATLAGLQVGDAVTLDPSYTVTPGPAPLLLTGGNMNLIVDGAIVAGLDTTTFAARAAVGFSGAGSTMYIAIFDGKQSHARGLTPQEVAQFMSSLGAANAMMIDGGGSAQIVARPLGESDAALINKPSDLNERPVPTGIGILAAPGSGQLTGINLLPAYDLDNTDRVFLGLSRQYRALGYDESLAPVAAGSVIWQAAPAARGSISADGLIVGGGEPGVLAISASAAGVTQPGSVRVLGPLVRIATSPARLSLGASSSSESSGSFRVIGYDAQGFSAPIEPRDISLSYDTAVAAISATSAGEFLASALTESGATLLTVAAGGVQRTIALTVGLEIEQVSDFEQLSQWTFTSSSAKITGGITSAAGRSGNAVQISYDFSQITSTRAAYLTTVAAAPYLQLPGQPQQIGMWVKSLDGRLPWLRAHLRHAGNTQNDVTVNLTAAYQEDVGTDWVYVEATIPSGLEFPLYLRRIYPVETSAARLYTGALIFDDLIVKVAQSLETPAETALADPLIRRAAPLGAERFSFAALSDTHVYSTSPDGTEAQLTRMALQRIKAQQPEFLIIHGDLVDVSDAASYTLAQTILSEELGVPSPFPIYYIPGNHELYPQSSGTIDAYLAAGNATRAQFDYKSIRFILLNSATGIFRTAEFPQMPELAAALDAAAQDSAIKHVFVIGHHPPDDPIPTKESQLADRLEAAWLQRTLADFLQRTGKGIAYLAGHSHNCVVSRVDGVPYIITPAGGKVPRGSADDGGFNGWIRFGIDPAADSDSWLQAEVHPSITGLSFSSAPAQLAPGETVAVAALASQARGLSIPIAYPVTGYWGGEHVLLDQAADDGSAVVRYDSTTGSVIGLRAGSAILRLEVNGIIIETGITVKGAAVTPTVTPPIATPTGTIPPSATPTGTIPPSATPTPTTSPGDGEHVYLPIITR